MSTAEPRFSDSASGRPAGSVGRLGIEGDFLVERLHQTMQPVERVARAREHFGEEFAQLGVRRTLSALSRRNIADGKVSSAPRTTPTASVVSISPTAETVKRSTGL